MKYVFYSLSDLKGEARPPKGSPDGHLFCIHRLLQGHNTPEIGLEHP